MNLARAKRILRLSFSRPGLWVASLVYSGIIFWANQRATILDIQDPSWVVTIAAVLLLSPLYHGIFLHVAGEVLRGRPQGVSAAVAKSVMAFPALFVGELLVNGLVIAGGLLLVIPGVYVGVRLAFYKQAIVLGGKRPMLALRESASRTGSWRRGLELFSSLAIFYSLDLGIDWLVVRVAASLVQALMSITLSALLLVWLNLFLTDWYLADSARAPEAPAAAPET